MASRAHTVPITSQKLRDRHDDYDPEEKMSIGEMFKKAWAEGKATVTDKSRRFDVWLAIIVCVLLTIGLFMMYSASYPTSLVEEGTTTKYLGNQLIFAAIGLAAMYIASLVPLWFIRRMVWPVFIFAIALLGLVLILPPVDGDHHRWIDLGFTTFQPSEVGKLAIIMMLAKWFADNADRIKKPFYGVLMPGVFAIVIGGLVAAEPHLSGFILIILIAGTLMISGGTQKRWIILLVALAVGAVLIVLTQFDYMQDRINAWLDPYAYKLTTGWQTLQAQYAVSMGGLFGRGIGNSTQKHLYVSEAHNDFIFSIVAEELGFVGCAVIIVIFALLIWRGFSISMSNNDRFARLLGIGIVSQIGWQTMLNIAVVVRALPNTGISLPFFSYGGTSLVMLLGSVGLLLAISRDSVKKLS